MTVFTEETIVGNGEEKSELTSQPVAVLYFGQPDQSENSV
jgi:hypothetical protein